MSRWTIAWALMCLGTSATAAEVERVTGAVPEEVAAYNETLARYEARVEELQADTLAFLQQQKARQVARLTADHDAQLLALDADAQLQRDAAITAFEGFLRRYDDVSATSEVRLRLAELYFQEAEAQWFAETTTYFEALDAAGDDLDALEALEARGEPRIDLTRVVSLLTSIVDANAGRARQDQYALLDVAYYMLAFCYAEENSAQFDRPRASQVFQELIEARPNSDFADAAHLMRGIYFFQENAYETSIPEFEAVLARGADAVQRKNYEGALYQLAWARYKRSEYDQATDLFVQLLDGSETRRRETGRDSEYQPDAVAYLALSLLDQSDAEGRTPLAQAQAFFARVGTDKAYRWDVLQSLAKALVDYARPRDAVEVYTALQVDPAFRTRPENPEFQDQVVKLLSRGYDADLAAAGDARLEMTERYGEGSVWFEANRTNPDAQAKARRIIEAYLLDVAIEVKVRAQESGDPDTYSLAADKYREYLERFPIADDYFANQFQLADALYRAGRADEAVVEYAALVRNARFHEYGDASLYMVFRAREQLLRERVGNVDARAEGAEVERTITSEAGTEVVVYELLDVQTAFIEAADAVLSHDFAPVVEGPDLAGIVRDNRAKILYLPAQMLYYANRFDEARPRLQKVILEHPDTDEAAYAANLFLNAYIAEGDNAAVRRWSREFASMRLGASGGLSSSQSKQFRDTYEQASYYLGTEAYERGDYAAAAEAYLAFVEEFPRSKNVPDALLSAAFNYQRMGRASTANELYERFIREFPDHPEARPFYFAIASNYEATFELDEAIRYYEAFVTRFPKDPDAPNAQYMIAFLKEGLGDAVGAARGYEAYAKSYPDAPDREDVHFRAGAMYELADSDRAIRFYEGYLKAYGITNPDHALVAQGTLADLYADKGRSRDAARANDAVVALFDRILEGGGTVGPAGRDRAAQSAFDDLLRDHDAITSRKLSRNELKDTKLLLDQLPADIKAFDAKASAFIEHFLSFPYTTAAMYLQGSVRKAYADLGFSVEPPAGMNMDSEAAYWELLEETLFPQMAGVEKQAADLLKRVSEVAAGQKRHAVWVDRAMEMLNDIDPAVYPAVKEPIAGSVDAVEAVVLQPLVPASDEAPATKDGGVP